MGQIQRFEHWHLVKNELNYGLEKITFTFYPVNRPLKNIWVIIKLTNACVTATANPAPNTTVNMTMV